jgi:hypothetical protein
MEDSILKSVKEMLGLGAADSGFNLNLITWINTAFGVLADLGVVPPGTAIEDDTQKWSELTAQADIGMIRSYIFLKVEFYHDTPATSFAIAAKEKQISELEFRLHTQREVIQPWPPLSPTE